jgi:MYXO-CTERM domain-containing protein
VALAEAPAFADYLTDRITVKQDGRACRGEARVADDLVTGGAEVLFTCPGPVSTVTVTSRMLTDLHEAYRTLARGPRGQKAVYDATHESADWTISDDTGTDSRPASTRTVAATPASSSARQLSVVGGVLLAVVAAGAFWHRRRRRKA